jgi:hypothetical protein
MSIKAPATEQFTLELQETSTSEPTRNTILVFIDAGTRAVRKEAIERVKKSGIFEPPKVSIR